MPDTPALSLGRLASARRCTTFLGALLDPETKRRPVAKGAFRLDNAVRETVRVAHELADQQASSVSETIDATPPPGLSAEERVRFVSAVETYVEFAGDDEVSLHPSVGEFLQRPSRSGRFRLTARNDTTVVDRAMGTLEIRRLHLGPWRPVQRPTVDPANADLETPPDAPVADPDNDALLSLLVTGGRPTNDERSVVAQVRHLWLGTTTHESIYEITSAHIADAGRRLTELTETALTRPATTPGWWCDACPVIRSCRAVVASPDTDMANRLRPAAHEMSQTSEML